MVADSSHDDLALHKMENYTFLIAIASIRMLVALMVLAAKCDPWMSAHMLEEITFFGFSSDSRFYFARMKTEQNIITDRPGKWAFKS
ncbi:hypothetical protein F2Q68_00002163 [Brassica cretica]|uniref:Uncharacterized protein n=1 Tax=Brassica cretica TaxID=69181 RepID=A0A8S9J8X8_BRACR|nr:hypothetical protein F2Q68_00002163 [Brassica cretica]